MHLFFKRVKLNSYIIVLLSFLFFKCGSIPPAFSPATRDYVDGQSLKTYSILDKKIKELEVLENQLNELIEQTQQNNYFINQLRAQNSDMSQEFEKQIGFKDNEIQKLTIQVNSLQKVLTNYDGIMDSLLFLNSKQSNIYNQLLSVEDSSDNKPLSIEKRQMLLVQKNLDSLRLNYSSLAKTTKNLYEDLGIVESSIMDIIQFSFQKSSKQIRDKHNYLLTRYNEMEAQQKTLFEEVQSLKISNKARLDGGQIDSLNTIDTTQIK